MSIEISWCDHKKSRAEKKKIKKSKFEPKAKKRRDNSGERWKRSGAMAMHHGCDEHYKRRTCPGCFVDQLNGAGFRPFYFEEQVKNLGYVKRITDKTKVSYIDKDLGTVYYERTIRQEHFDFEL